MTINRMCVDETIVEIMFLGSRIVYRSEILDGVKADSAFNKCLNKFNVLYATA